MNQRSWPTARATVATFRALPAEELQTSIDLLTKFIRPRGKHALTRRFVRAHADLARAVKDGSDTTELERTFDEIVVALNGDPPTITTADVEAGFEELLLGDES
jgi:hypothetical protein